MCSFSPSNISRSHSDLVGGKGACGRAYVKANWFPGTYLTEHKKTLSAFTFLATWSYLI